MVARSSYHTVRTHCPSCPLNCGFELEVNADGEILGRRRWKGAPLGRGALCPVGEVAWQSAERPERLTRPLVRRHGRLETTGWADALDRAAAGLADLARRFGSDANAVLADGSLTNEKAYLLGKLARVGLRTRHVDRVDRSGLAPAREAHREAFGRMRPMTPLDDLARADVILVVGGDPADTHPVVVPDAVSRARRRGAEVITIGSAADPDGRIGGGSLRLGGTQGRSGPVLLGLLAELERTGAIDWSFVTGRTDDIEATLRAARPWTAERVAAASGVDGDALRLAARSLGAARRGFHLVAPAGSPDGPPVLDREGAAALMNLALACGHAGRTGSGVVVLSGERNDQGVVDWGLGHRSLPAGRSIDDPFHRAVMSRRWGFDGGQIPPAGAPADEIERMLGDGRIRGLLRWGGDAPADLDHCVVVDPFPSEATMANADVVLPGTVLVEEEGTVTTVEGRLVRCDRAVPPAARYGDIDIVRNLARRLGCRHHFDFVRGREVWEEMRRVSVGAPDDHFGLTWDRARDGVFPPCPDEDHPGTPRLFLDGFATADGRARFRPVALDPPPAGSDPGGAGQPRPVEGAAGDAPSLLAEAI
jgi:assimilatory nitrate reductase catalytic subunit